MPAYANPPAERLLETMRKKSGYEPAVPAEDKAIVEQVAETLPAIIAAKPPIQASVRIAPIIPSTFEDCQRIGAAVYASGLAPSSYKTGTQCAIAIMHGLELGIPPMVALNKISVINGRPTVGADLALALAMRTGMVTFFKERVTGTGKEYTAHCEIGRRGIDERASSSFSYADAERAGLLDMRPVVKSYRNGKSVEIPNPAPWYRYPRRMMQMRARKCIYDLFGDVIGGVWMTEEMEGVAFSDQPSASPEPVIIEPPPRAAVATVPVRHDLEMPDLEPPPSLPDEEWTGEKVSESPADIPPADDEGDL